jgi:hypothetical protein
LVVDEHPNDDIDSVGLFSRVAEGGEIRNVELEDINVTGKQSVGGLVGQVSGSTISNTSVSGSITVLADGGNVGGLVGDLRDGENTRGKIINSSADGSVAHNGAGGTSSSAGGLVGHIGPNSDVEESSVSATVTGEGDGIRVGGLIGTSFGTITDVSASGDVTDETEAGMSTVTGGLIGFVAEGTVEKASTSGDVTGNSFTGGCFGQFGAGGSDEAVAVDISASGEVEGSETVGGLAGRLSSNSEMTNASATGSVEGTEEVGGLVGTANGSITEATAAGKVSGADTIGGLAGSVRAAITECRATGDIESEGSAGGLAGTKSEGSIERSVATGDVDSTGQSVGGLVGSNFPDGKIKDSYAMGNVQSTDGQVGGLVGGGPGTIDSCFATGTVDGSFLVGGLVGNESDGAVEDSYWDTGASEQDESPVGEGLTTAQMTGETAPDNMTGFDFSGTWQTVVENQEINGTTPDTDGYPILRQLAPEPQLGAEGDPNSADFSLDPCFIATAAYDTPAASEIDVLRDFRDDVLQRNAFGRLIIKTYYWGSPPIARWIRRDSTRRELVKQYFVKPLVTIVDRKSNVWRRD